MLPTTMESHDTRSPTSRPPWQLRVGRTVAVFTWHVDRWTHRIASRGDATDGGGGWESVEGPGPAADPRWPASPVLVELSRIAVPRAAPPEDSVVVGIGLAGRSHFSASIAPDPNAADTIRFEIACRLHEAPVWLGSTYRLGGRLFRVAAPVAAAPLPRTVVWAYSIGPQGIVGVSGADLAMPSE